MKQWTTVALALAALAPLTVWAHAGHGLAPGHDWFHALVPLAGAALIVAVRALVLQARAHARVSRSRKQ